MSLSRCFIANVPSLTYCCVDGGAPPSHPCCRGKGSSLHSVFCTLAFLDHRVIPTAVLYARRHTWQPGAGESGLPKQWRANNCWPLTPPRQPGGARTKNKASMMMLTALLMVVCASWMATVAKNKNGGTTFYFRSINNLIFGKKINNPPKFKIWPCCHIKVSIFYNVAWPES